MTDPAGGTRFSVVVVHRNGTAMLLQTLAALAAALGPRDEMLLVDNASEDDSVASARAAHPALRIVANDRNTGFAHACNQGLAAASGRYRLLLNNDALVPPSLLDRLEADFLAEPRAGLIGPALVGEDGVVQRTHGVLPQPWHEVAPRFLRPRVPRLSGTGLVEVEMLVGACVAVRQEALVQVGGLDESFFFYYEDVEWSHRLRAAGWRLLLDQDCRVVHRRGGSTRPVRAGAQLERFRSRLVYYRRVFPPLTANALCAYRWLRLPLDLLLDALAVALTLGRRARARARLAAHLHVLRWLLAGRPWHWGLPGKRPSA